ncbi:hypothetical protein T210_0131465 [Burkholderia pseudomallei MSHR6137]|nr:hypothetical protein T210_0131465 [Burkholderia pseudomallei MSHR6137]
MSGASALRRPFDANTVRTRQARQPGASLHGACAARCGATRRRAARRDSLRDIKERALTERHNVLVAATEIPVSSPRTKPCARHAFSSRLPCPRGAV